jgi:DNA-binding MarR family transcriptional regulator
MTARQSTKAELIPALIADVFELAGALQASSDALAAVAGQTGARWQVLWVADEAARTVPDIARRLGRTRQAVQRLADILVDDRLAEWQTNPAHSRSPFLVLTADGRRALGAIMRVSDAWRSDVGDAFTAAELATVRDVVQRLSARIAAVPVRPARSKHTLSS